jgi:hypothetical protein
MRDFASTAWRLAGFEERVAVLMHNFSEMTDDDRDLLDWEKRDAEFRRLEQLFASLKHERRPDHNDEED